MDAPASLIIDPMNILGKEGGRFKRCGGFFEPPERKGGWRATRKKRCVTCRPHRSLKDSVLCSRSCLAPPQNINTIILRQITPLRDLRRRARRNDNPSFLPLPLPLPPHCITHFLFPFLSFLLDNDGGHPPSCGNIESRALPSSNLCVTASPCFLLTDSDWAQ